MSYQRHVLHPHTTLILGGRSAQAGSASPCGCGLEGPAHPTAAHRAHSSPRRTPCGAPLLLALGGSSRCWSPVSGGVLFPGTIRRCERCFVTFHVVPRTTPPFRKPRPTRQQGGAPPFKTLSPRGSAPSSIAATVLAGPRVASSLLLRSLQKSSHKYPLPHHAPQPSRSCQATWTHWRCSTSAVEQLPLVALTSDTPRDRTDASRQELHQTDAKAEKNVLFLIGVAVLSNIILQAPTQPSVPLGCPA